MRILVWGLGYVGTVSAACFARLGHEVIGVEPNQTKVDAINMGESAIKEPGLQELVSLSQRTGQLRATTRGEYYIADTDISLICVGTPSCADGSPQLEYVKTVAQEIGRGLQHTSRYHVVCLRSTVFPGTSRTLLGPILEKESGKKLGVDFGLVMNPEFLREGSAVNDFATPPYTIVGGFDSRSSEIIERLYEKVDAPVKHTSLEVAEFLKIINNVFHALKVGFSNEIGRLCDVLQIDSHQIMELVCADSKLNISPAYLRPGFAFGGSCLPKDLRSVTYHARMHGVDIPILDAILPSNAVQITIVRMKLQELGAKKVGILGLSFKSGTDDLRESPIIGLIRELWQDGMDVLIYDPDVNPEKMLGSNLAFLERQLPQISEILCSNVDDVIGQSDVIVVGKKLPELVETLEAVRHTVTILDLARLSDRPESLGFAKYKGISW